MTLKSLLNSLLNSKTKTDLPSPPKADAELRVQVYYDLDCVELEMFGGEANIGGAIITLMLKDKQFNGIIHNCVEAVDREMHRRWVRNEIKRISNLN